MRYGSICSGIESATVAWHPLGWTAAYYAENAAFPSAVLAHHYPRVPNLGDITRFKDWPDATIDLLVGGTPCQSFSVAGLRKGLADPRGNLALTFLAIAARYRPRWILWENVPGILSSGGGRDFAAFLGALGELGYGWAYRVLDAQHFGVPQRRRRVFVVGCARGWVAAAAVLFESACMQGHPAPSREAREDVAGAVTSSLGHRGHGSDRGDGAHLVAGTLGASHGNVRADAAWNDQLIARCATSREGSRQDYETETLIAAYRNDADTAENLIAFDTTQITHPENRSRPDDRSPQLAASTHPPAIAFNWKAGEKAGTTGATEDLVGSIGTQSQHAVAFNARQDHDVFGDRTGPLDTDGSTQAVSCDYTNGLIGSVTGTLEAAQGKGNRGHGVLRVSVRRLTPRECERLQGFPDDYTLIPLTRRQRKRVDAEFAAYMRRNYPEMTDTQIRHLAKDGPRYKAIGNSKAVPVVRWIGQRIELVDRLIEQAEERAA